MSELPRTHNNHRFDVRALMGDPQFRKDVSRINFKLAAFSKENEITPEASEAEQREIVGFNEQYFPLSTLERPLTLVTSYFDAQHDELGIDRLTGRFLGAVPIVDEPPYDLIDRTEARAVPGIARRALGFLFREDDVEESDNIAVVRIDESSILAMTIETPPHITEAMSTREILALLGENFTHIVTSQTFLEADLESQQSQILALMDEVTERYPLFRSRNKQHVFIVEVQNADSQDEVQEIIAKEAVLMFSEFHLRETPYRTLDDFEDGDELCAALVQDDETIHFVPLSQIIDITPHITTSIPDSLATDASEFTLSEDEVNFLSRFNEQNFRDFVSEVEKDMNADYAPTDDFDEDEFVEAKGRYISQLDAMAAADVERYFFRFSGLVYREDIGHEDILQNPEWESHDEAVSDGFDLKLIDGRWRVVWTQEVPTDYSEATDEGDVEFMEPVYIIPSSDNLSSMVAYLTADTVVADEDLPS